MGDEAPIRLAGLVEAAEMCGSHPAILRALIDAGTFPPPFQVLAQGEVWLRSQIEEYRAERPPPAPPLKRPHLPEPGTGP